MTGSVRNINELPNTPAIYAMYEKERDRLPVYVGLGTKLKSRVMQHLVRRDSSVTTGASAVSLNPDLIRLVRWWEHPRFGDDTVLHAAELVAFIALTPSLRSRGRPRKVALKLSQQQAFRSEVEKLFAGQAAGTLRLPSLASMGQKLDALEDRIASLERQARKKHRS